MTDLVFQFVNNECVATHEITLCALLMFRLVYIVDDFVHEKEVSCNRVTTYMRFQLLHVFVGKARYSEVMQR